MKTPWNGKKDCMKLFLNPFHVTDLFRYPLKTSENQRLSDVFRGYQKRPVAWNGLTDIQESKIIYFANYTTTYITK